MKDHELQTIDEGFAATCVKDGKTATQKCENCTYEEGGAVIPKNDDHIIITHSGTEATCTENGYTGEYDVCQRTGCTYTTYDKSSEIPALGFTAKRVEDKYYVLGSKTCEQAARYYYSCAKCGKRGNETFSYGEPAEHSRVQNPIAQYFVEAANCQHGVVYYLSCDMCGMAHKETFFYGNPLDHDEIVGGKFDTPSSCTKDGEKVTYCYNCEEWLETEVIPATGHKYQHNTINPTCLEDGYTEHICSYCQDTYRDSEVPKYVHAPKETWNTENPVSHYRECKYNYDRCGEIFGLDTHTMESDVIREDCADGYKFVARSYCTVCGYEERSNESFVHVCTDVTLIPEKRPTCIKTGLTAGAKCSCGQIICPQTEIPRMEHKFFRGVCCWCGERQGSEGLKFVSNGDGTCYVSGIGTCTDNYLIIPSVHDGMLVTGIGNSAFRGCDSLTSVIIPDSVTSIGGSAFYGCKSLTNVTIGNSVTSIGSYAFRDCDILTAIVIPDSVESIMSDAFYSCDSLTSVIIGNGVEIIESYAFARCSSLTSIIIPDSVTSIGAYAFENCNSLASVTIGNSVTSIGDDAFYSCDSLASIIIPDSVTSIGDSAFRGCSSLTSVTMGSGVTSIGESAFEHCYELEAIYITDIEKWCGISFDNFAANPLFHANNLYLKGNLVTELVIPNSVASIGSFSFYFCDSITSVIIPDSVLSIGSKAFYQCPKLTSVRIGSGVTEIGYCAFWNCQSLKSIEVDLKNSTYQSIDENLYNEDGKNLIQYSIGKTDPNFSIPTVVTSIDDYAFYGCDSLTSVTIPDGVTSIGYSAFSWCDNITSIIIPDSVISIGNNAFAYCKKLKSITIGIGVITLGDSAFRDCDRLVSIVIPDSVENIENEAFCSCNSLTYVTIGSGVTSIGYSAFSNCDDLTSITVDEDNLTYQSIDENLYSKDGTTLIQYAIGKTDESFTIPDGVTSIGNSAFSNCDSLVSIIIPDSVTSIGSYAFAYCDSLASIIIPDSVTSIGENAFYSCDSLTSVTIGSGVTSIGIYAFSYCDSLTSVTFENADGWWYSSNSTATSGTSISSTDLANTSTAAKYLISTYKSYYWKRS